MNNLMKTFILSAVLFLAGSTLNAQNLYVRLGGGYGFPSGVQTIDDFNNVTVDDNGKTVTEQEQISLGKGLNFGGLVGYKFNDYFGAELGVSMLMGSEYTAKTVTTFSADYSEQTISGKMLRFNPSLVVYSGMEGINPYAKFGLVIGTGAGITTGYKQVSGNNISVYEAELDGGSALGFSGGLGLLYDINDNLSLFGEFNVIDMSYAPTHAKLTKASLNGEDFLNLMTTHQKETIFVDELVEDPSDTPSDGEPNKALKQYYPFSSMGINLGIQYSF